MWHFLHVRIGRSHSPEVHHFHPKHPSIHPCTSCFAGSRTGRRILTLLRGCTTGTVMCPVRWPRVFPGPRPNHSSREHQQQIAETSFPLTLLSIHLSNMLLFKQNQAAQEAHRQLTAFRRTSSKFSSFSFVIFISLWPHFASVIFLPYVENCYGA